MCPSIRLGTILINTIMTEFLSTLEKEPNANVQLIVTLSDLKEFATSLIKELADEKSNSKEKEELLLTTSQVANKLQCDPSTLWRWAKVGYLVPIRVGQKKRYRLSDINKILNEKEA